MMSVYSLLFAIMLFSEMNSFSVTVAMPSTTVNEGASEQESLGSILADVDMTESAVVPLMYRRSLTDDGTPKVIVIPDMKLKGHSIHGLNLPLTRSYPLVTERGLDPDQFTLKINKREKDLDMLRCMIGRVYRPCWEV